MKQVFVVFIVFFLLLMSCSDRALDADFRQLSYELKPAFSFVIPDHPSSTSSLQTKKIGNKEYLFLGDVKRFDRIFIYNISENKWEDPIEFELQGPNGIGRLDGFFIKSLDSIFTVHSFGWKIHLMDHSEKIRSYPTNDGLKTTEQVTPFTSENPLSGIVENKLAFFGFPELSPKESSYYTDARAGGAIDLFQSTIITGGKHPIQYRGHQWPGVNTISDRQAVIGDMIVHSFSLSDSVYLFDSSYELVRSIPLYSSKKQKTENFDNLSFEEAAGERGYFEMLSKGYYSGIIADDKRGLLYRTISYSDFDPQNFPTYFEYKQSAKRGLSIYDINHDKLVGEIFFKNGELDDIPMMFVGEDGLYLSKRNPLEEGVEFYLLDISKELN